MVILEIGFLNSVSPLLSKMLYNAIVLTAAISLN